MLILTAGFFTGVICKKLQLSMIAGYFIVGIVIGKGGFDLVAQNHHELEFLAEAGAMLLLFSVGIEFSFGELVRLSRFFLVGGATQMTLVTIPLIFICLSFGMDKNAAILSALSASLSSTVLVFKALNEWGQSTTEHGRRGIGILLFQDVALVPLMLIIPLLAGGVAPEMKEVFKLMGQAALFIAAVIVTRKIVGSWIIPLLYSMRSVELLVLFTLSLLLGTCIGSQALGLPPAIGALAAGLMLSGNRLSRQIDTIILPFRELFASIFFVSLGTLLMPGLFLQEPVLLSVGLVGMILLKTGAATVALRLTGLNWRSSAGMGVGLSQLGEFSFLLISTAMVTGAISAQDYNRMLFIALGSLMITPQLMKYGLKFIGCLPSERKEDETSVTPALAIKKAIIVGTGPYGRQAASNLELMGQEVCIIDLSPVNLHDFSVQGFNTITGDARDPEVLERANVTNSDLALVCITKDEIAIEIIKAIREQNENINILLHCRYQTNVSEAKEAGANVVVTEESEAFKEMGQTITKLMDQSK